MLIKTRRVLVWMVNSFRKDFTYQGLVDLTHPNTNPAIILTSRFAVIVEFLS